MTQGQTSIWISFIYCPTKQHTKTSLACLCISEANTCDFLVPFDQYWCGSWNSGMELFNISFIIYMNSSWIKCLLQPPTKFWIFPQNWIWGFSSPLRAPCGVSLAELDFDNKISTGPISEQKEKWTIKSIFCFWMVVVLTTAVVGVNAVQSVLGALPNIELKSTTTLYSASQWSMVIYSARNFSYKLHSIELARYLLHRQTLATG